MKINNHALHYQPQLASPVLPELSVLGVPVRKVIAKRAGQLGLCWNDSTNSRPPAQGHTCNYDLRHRPARGLGNTLQGSGFRIQGCKGTQTNVLSIAIRGFRQTGRTLCSLMLGTVRAAIQESPARPGPCSVQL